MNTDNSKKLTKKWIIAGCLIGLALLLTAGTAVFFCTRNPLEQQVTSALKYVCKVKGKDVPMGSVGCMSKKIFMNSVRQSSFITIVMYGYGEDRTGNFMIFDKDGYIGNGHDSHSKMKNKENLGIIHDFCQAQIDSNFITEQEAYEGKEGIIILNYDKLTKDFNFEKNWNILMDLYTENVNCQDLLEI